MKNNEKGIALITTLVLGLAALAFIGALLYFLTSGTKISGTEKRYYTALEAAKGGAKLIMANLLDSSTPLTCNGSVCNPCPDPDNATNINACKIDLSVSTLGDYDIEAYLLAHENDGISDIYTIRVKAKNTNNLKEKAEVEFVYRVK